MAAVRVVSHIIADAEFPDIDIFNESSPNVEPYVISSGIAFPSSSKKQSVLRLSDTHSSSISEMDIVYLNRMDLSILILPPLILKFQSWGGVGRSTLWKNSFCSLR